MEKVFTYFRKISNIPRCSGDEKRISDYLVNFAKQRNLNVIQDDALNVIIKKEGTKGYENSPCIVIQGHMDMVCEKEKLIQHDFSKDPIKIKQDGDLLKAEGTTLGADDGIAVAMCLALLDSNDIPHPPLEVLITTEEETGMGGAHALNPDNIQGRTLINIDSEEEGIFLVSCAGGARNRITIPILWNNISEGLSSYLIKIEGLKGGHSGSEIDKGRANSNILMGRVLYQLQLKLNYNLIKIDGGTKTNAIPRYSEALIAINKSDENKLKEFICSINKEFKNEFKSSDSEVSIDLEKSNENINNCFSKETLNKVISVLTLIPNGVQTMSKDIEGLVESSNNLGIVQMKDNKVIFESALRSSVKSLKKNISNKINILASNLDVKSENYGEYPEWEYNENSRIREVFEKVYKRKYNKSPKISAIHAGLECGLFKEKFKNIDMISFGPQMNNVHTTSEYLSISSTNRTWELLVDVLKELK